MNLVEKRRASLINMTFLLVVLVVYYFFVKYAFWIAAPFLFAFIIATILQKPIAYIDKKTFLNKKLASVILVLLMVALLSGIIVLIVYKLYSEISTFVIDMKNKYFVDYSHSIMVIKGWIEGGLSRLPAFMRNKVAETIDGLTNSALNLAEKQESVQQSGSSISLSTFSGPIAGLLSTAKQVPAVLTAILISIISCIFLTSDYHGFTQYIKDAVSEETEAKLVQAKHVVVDILGKWVKSYALLMFITFVEMSVGLSVLKAIGIFKSDYIIAIAVITALVDIFPVLGTGTIIWPWAIFCFCTHKISMAIGLLVIYGIITVIRQIIEPKIVSSSVDVHPIITIMSMYIGSQIFGVMGIFILPITVVIINTLAKEGIIQLSDKSRKKAENEAPENAEITEETSDENTEKSDPAEETEKEIPAEVNSGK